MSLPLSAATSMLDATMLHKTRTSSAEKIAPNTMTHDGIRIVPPHEYKEAAACLAEAFRFDKIVRYAIDTPDREQIPDEERYDCVALWLPPGKNIDDWITILRSGMWRLIYKLSKEGRTRFFDEFLPLLHKTKLEILGERDNNSWYLNYVGTKPEARRKGYAKKVIEYVTKLADAHGQPCYLESSHDINLVIYGKLGFELRKQIYLTRSTGEDLRMDVMVREPASTHEENVNGAMMKSG